MEKIEYRKLTDFKPSPKNPRKQGPKGVKELAESIKNNPRFFEARPIILSDRTGELLIIAGERRSEAAALLGMTEVPTILLSGLTEAEEDEIMIRDNTHEGVWDAKKLKEWETGQLKGWGITKADVKWVAEDKYTRKIVPPTYELKGEMPSVGELYDTTKADELTAKIKRADIPEDIKDFLCIASTRHIVFNYEKIAEFYAHASAEIQQLFEDNALVIIDFEDAIGGGYIKLCKDLIEQYKIEQDND